MSRDDWTVSSLRAHWMRKARTEGNQAAFDQLCMFQHFDCSQIAQMAGAAREQSLVAEPTTSCVFLFLPADHTWLEWVDDTRNERVALALTQDSSPKAIRVSIFTCFDVFSAGSIWQDVDKITYAAGVTPATALWACECALRLLQIINQPGLCSAEPGQSRWIKSAAKGWVFGAVPTSWGRVTIRPGTHGQSGERESAGTMPLHFVRAHRKPKLSEKMGREIIVASRWRGNIANGLRLKEYIAHEELAWARNKQREYLAGAA